MTTSASKKSARDPRIIAKEIMQFGSDFDDGPFESTLDVLELFDAKEIKNNSLLKNASI